MPEQLNQLITSSEELIIPLLKGMLKKVTMNTKGKKTMMSTKVKKIMMSTKKKNIMMSMRKSTENRLSTMLICLVRVLH